MITKEMLEKYNMLTLSEYKEIKGDTPEVEEIFYKTFLGQTDYIHEKIEDLKAIGENVPDYSEVIKARCYARDQINLIKGKEQK